MNNICYLVFNIFGFIGLFLSIYIFNKKYKVLSLEYLIYSYVFFVIGFIIFAKIFHIILDKDYVFNATDSMLELLKFIFSGYTFIGGIIGGILGMFLFSIIGKIKFSNIALLFLPSMLLMYSLMKIGCYFEGCCKGINDFNIQLVESTLNMAGYICVIYFLNNKKSIMYYSSLIFGLLRFVISFFRVYPNKLSFWFIQFFCILLILYGLYGLIYGKKGKKKEKLCKKG